MADSNGSPQPRRGRGRRPTTNMSRSSLFTTQDRTSDPATLTSPNSTVRVLAPGYTSTQDDSFDATFHSCADGDDIAEESEDAHAQQRQFPMPSDSHGNTRTSNEWRIERENVRPSDNFQFEKLFLDDGPYADSPSSDEYVRRPVIGAFGSDEEFASQSAAPLQYEIAHMYPYSEEDEDNHIYRSMSSTPDVNGPSHSSATVLKHPKKLCFLINEEHGQANVCMAVMYELILRRKYEVHVISWSKLEETVKSVGEFALTNATNEEKETFQPKFHALPGMGMVQSLISRSPGYSPFQGRGVKEYKRIFKEMCWSFGDAAYNQSYIESVAAAVALLEMIRPKLVVLEPAMSQGFDACQRVEQPYIVLGPNSLKDCLMFKQGLWSVLTKYPAFCSGFSYPVPRSKVFQNMKIFFKLIGSIRSSSELKSLNAARHAHGMSGPLALTEVYRKDRFYIYASCPDTDFPLKNIPMNIVPCGPIILPPRPVPADRPIHFHEWLQNTPTIFINFGSHYKADEQFATEMAIAITKILSEFPDTQFIWKLAKKGTYDISHLLPNQTSHDQVHIFEDWMDEEPSSILESPQVVCLVHHGGANSYHEAVAAGVPQVICPLWLDCIDYAARVEYLGIGIDGNKKVGFSIEANEVANAVIRVLIEHIGGDEFDTPKCMKVRARALAEASKRYGGRHKAAGTIVDIVEILN